MSTEGNKETARRFFEAASTGNLEVYNDILVDEFVTHGDALFPFFRGREGMKQGVGGFRNAFPDATLTVQHMFAEDNKVMARVVVNATQQKEWMGIPAPECGRKMTWTASTIIRFDDNGRMTERWVIEDELGMTQQLGLMPKAAQ